MTHHINLAAQHAQEATKCLKQWAELDECERRVPQVLVTVVPLLVYFAHQCARHQVKVSLCTRPALRLVIGATRAALDAIEETLLLSYERDRQEAAAQDAKWLRAGTQEAHGTPTQGMSN